MAPDRLPVQAALPDLRAALAGPGVAVLVAPPGSGKTTGVPPALLDQPWAADGRIVMTEPRRLAVRAAARRMASVRGEAVGGVVGYAVRGDHLRSDATRIEVVTEGLLVRRLQQDPALDGVAAVVLDEFHERSLDLDLALALVADVRASLRPDLRVVVMSATIDPGPVADLLGRGAAEPAPVIRIDVPVHPVQTRYRPGSAHDRLEDRVADVVVEATRAEPGDVLVFLPGRPEIRRTVAALRRRPVPGDVTVLELHGSLDPAEQDRALSPDPTGRRRVVLSTSIAETSLTVPGVRVVVDAGRRRTGGVDPATGLPGLVTGPVSRAGADQRRGRAGRTAPGVCYRLWSPEDERHRPAADRPEIVDGDLAALVLQVRSWGAASLDDLAWLEPPGAAPRRAAEQLLADLGAVDGDGRLTDRGRSMAALGFHPRLAAVAGAAGDGPADDGVAGDRSAGVGAGSLAPALAAVLEVDRPGEVDLVERVRDLQRGRAPEEVRQAERQWRRQLGGRADRGARSRRRGTGTGSGSGDDRSTANPGDLDRRVGRAVLAGFPDRVARRRPGRRTDDRGRPQAVYLLRTGGEVALPSADHPLARSEWLVVPGLDRGAPGSVGRVHLAAAITVEDALGAAAGAVEEEREVRWDRRAGDVVAVVRRRLGAITLDEVPWAEPDPGQVRGALAQGLAAEGPALFRRWGEADGLRSRVELLRRCGVPCPDPAGWPDLSDQHVGSADTSWAQPLLAGARRRADLARVDVAALLVGHLSWAARRALDDLAPKKWALPGGRAVPLRYERTDAGEVDVVMSTRLQDLLGLDEHPTVAGGRVPIMVELLSPAGRPVQRTSDLPGFWRGSYAAVRADLRGRYPKHRWPERPWE